jgi:hypothetical protein
VTTSAIPTATKRVGAVGYRRGITVVHDDLSLYCAAAADNGKTFRYITLLQIKYTDRYALDYCKLAKLFYSNLINNSFI